MQPGQAFVALQPQAGVLLTTRRVSCHTTQAIDVLLLLPPMLHLLPLQTKLEGLSGLWTLNL